MFRVEEGMEWRVCLEWRVCFRVEGMFRVEVESLVE